MPPAPRREILTGALHLFVLAGFALAQPLYDLLARSPEFFLVRRAGAAELLLPVLVFSIAVPSGLVALELAAGLLGVRVRRAVHTVLVGLLVATIALPVLARTGWPTGEVPLAGALAIGVAGAAAYGTLAPVRMFVGALAPAVLVFPGLYLARTRHLLAPPVQERTEALGPPAVDASVVMVVFDEFPLGSLLDAGGDIDAIRYPSFARLAREALWFRNATTVASVTQAAIPALLTGRVPAPDPLGDPSIRARNLFTLLAGSHRLDVTESYVPFCPAHLCGERPEPKRSRPALARDLAVLALRCVLPVDRWAGLPEIAYGSMLVQPGPAGRIGVLGQLLAAQRAHDTEALGRRARLFSDFIARLGRDERPALHYLHVMLPHEPSVHLPSGTICTADRRREPGRWPAAEWRVARAYQRHLLQVEFVDRMIGRLIDRLQDSGAWDSTLLVVTADHGVSFRPGDLRRALTATNECDVLRVPLFVKPPGRHPTGGSDRNVESIDVLPTIAAALGATVPWPMDGDSALPGATGERTNKVVAGPCWPEEQPLFAAASRRRMPADFGMRCGAPLHAFRWFDAGPSDGLRPFAIGPHRELLGRRAADLDASGSTAWRVAFAHGGAALDVVPGSGALPCPIEGRVRGEGAGSGTTVVAIALAGTIEAVTETEAAGPDEAVFSVVVPEAAFRPGRNDVEAYRVLAGAGAPRLQRLVGGADASPD